MQLKQQFCCWRLLVMWANKSTWNVFGSGVHFWLPQSNQFSFLSRNNVEIDRFYSLWSMLVGCSHTKGAVTPRFSCFMRRAVGLPQTSVPLSAVCPAQTWTNCSTSPPFLLFPFPFCAAFLPHCSSEDYLWLESQKCGGTWEQIELVESSWLMATQFNCPFALFDF